MSSLVADSSADVGRAQSTTPLYPLEGRTRDVVSASGRAGRPEDDGQLSVLPLPVVDDVGRATLPASWFAIPDGK